MSTYTPTVITPIPVPPVSLVTPFTYRDLITYLDILYGLAKYTAGISGELDATLAKLIEDVNASLEAQAELVNAALENQIIYVNDSIADMIQYVDDAVQSIINSSITVSDPVIYGVLNNASSQSRLLVEKIVGENAFTIDKSYATLEEALAAVPSGGTLELRKAYTRSTTFTVNKPCTIRFAHGAAITVTDGDIAAITVAANNVTLVSPKLIGNGLAAIGTGMGITSAPGTTGLKIQNPNISLFRRDGIRLINTTDFEIIGGLLTQMAYAGIMLLGCSFGSVTRVHVKDITQPAWYPGSYGIAVTRDSSVDLVTSPRPTDVVVSNNIVEGVTKWEALDTHGGIRISFTDNLLRNNYIGVSCVACPNTTNTSDLYAPLEITITGNIIDSTMSDGTRASGIVFVGAGDSIGTGVNEFATGVIANNFVARHGKQDLANDGGIMVYFTKGVIIANNVIVEAGGMAINVYHDNFGLAIFGNTATDTWSQTTLAYTATIFIRSTFNSLTMGGNITLRATKTATLVNARGLYVVGATDVTIIDTGNDFEATTLPYVDASNSSSFITRAKKIGFYGVAPVARPAALSQIYSTSTRTLQAYTPNDQSASFTGTTGDATAAKLADLNALRVAYNNLKFFVENLAGHHNAVVDDLQLYGLEA